jgi:Glycosyltransferase family 17
MEIIDVFPYCDEYDLAILRLNYLSKRVDHFVVGEFDTTFSGQFKGYNFNEVLDNLPMTIREKVTYKQFHQEKISSNHFQNDDIQKNALSAFVCNEFTNTEIILLGDCDEIPSISAIDECINNEKVAKHEVCHFAQRNFIGFLNYEEKTGCILSVTGEFKNVKKRFWLGTAATNVKSLRILNFSGVRNCPDISSRYRVEKGGWHFSFCNGNSLGFEQRLRKKMSATAHQEFNNELTLSQAVSRMKKFQDPFGRRCPKKRFSLNRYPKFYLAQIDETYPDWLVDNLKQFSHLLYSL